MNRSFCKTASQMLQTHSCAAIPSALNSVAAHLPVWASEAVVRRAAQASASVRMAPDLVSLSSVIHPLSPDAKPSDIAGLYGASFEISPVTAHLLPQALLNLSDESVLLLDNACLALWQGGASPSETYIREYEKWAYPLVDGHERIHALIPDYVSGAESDNMGLIVAAYASCSTATQKLFAIWHPHESDEQLEDILYLGFTHIAIGASPLYPSQQTTQWHQRVARALCIVEEAREASKLERHVHIMAPKPEHSLMLQNQKNQCAVSIPSKYQHLIWGHRHSGDTSLEIDDH